MSSNETARTADVTPVVARIWHTLAGLGDPERAVAQQAYMKSETPFRGLTSPELAATLKPILADWEPPTRAGWEQAIRELWDDVAYREEWYAALALLRHRHGRGWLDPELLGLLRHLITTGAWWDVVDVIATHPLRDALAAYPDEIGPVMRAWARDDDLWLRRSAVLCQVGRKAQTDRALLLDAIEANLADRSFWLRKAIGWALRDQARHDPAWVLAQVERWGTDLSGLSRREALKHHQHLA
ncbi:DNA alkylation repair protein [Nocardioides sp.]|uniref:DNA alkylation repair protein n=1 Tax=Nocardioides sp. TaxID=35761 RepID=UPI0026144E5B|nr:DNA alkylation repair protein [Nocardioides sp.]